jgi:ankyrin repeat protein
MVVERLLAVGADVNAAAAVFSDRRTALQVAAEGKHNAIVQQLLEKGAVKSL